MYSSIFLEVGDVEVGQSIKPTQFGGEYLGWTGFPGWVAQAERFDIQHIRWPAGIIAEDRLVDGVYAYDITQPNLVDSWPRWNANARVGLTEMFAYSNESNASFALIIPTGRYVEEMFLDEAAALQSIRDDIAIFTQRLFSGHWGALPGNLVLEIGAEYYSRDAWRAHSEDPRVVEFFANVFTEIVANLSTKEQEFGSDVFDIAVQSGRFQSDIDVSGDRDGEEADSGVFLAAYQQHGVLSDIDALIWHRYVYAFEQISHHLALDGAGAETTLSEHLTFWEDALAHSLELVVSWASPDVDSSGASESDTHFDYGPRSGLNTIQMFSYLAAAGVDTASLYGIDSPWIGAVSSGGVTPDDFQLAYNGEVYRMMIESLPGLSVLSGFDENQVYIDATNTPIETDHVNVNAFSDFTAKTVAFLSAWDLKSSEVAVSLTAPETHDTNFIQVAHLTPSGPDHEDGGEFTLGQFDYRGGIVQIEGLKDFDIVRVEFFEYLPATLSENVSLSDNSTGRIWDRFSELDDFIFVPDSTQERVTDAGAGEDWIAGSEGSDTIVGGAGSDQIQGRGGSDLILGDGVSFDDVQGWLSATGELLDAS